MRSKYPKVFKFLGIGFKNSGPYVTRRYTLIKKKKTSDTNSPGKGDVFIDVELFALDLNIRFFSPESGRITDNTIGGILDIPFMRPKEFGYEVAQTKLRGIVYRNALSGKITNNQKIYIASREFLIEDIYLMHKLKLRPEKKEKDRRRLVKLSQLFNKNITASESIDDVYKKVRGKLNSHGNKRFNLKKLKWVKESNKAYVKNEVPLRPKQAMNIPKNINTSKTLYGYNPNRDKWINKDILNAAAAIPFIGLKN
jgi:hypothetical protein